MLVTDTPGLPKWRLVYWPGAAALLALPALAMQVTGEVAWGAGDFIVMGLLLVLAGLAMEGAVRMARSPIGRLTGMAGVGLVFLLIWAELAVGLLR